MDEWRRARAAECWEQITRQGRHFSEQCEVQIWEAVERWRHDKNERCIAPDMRAQEHSSKLAQIFGGEPDEWYPYTSRACSGSEVDVILSVLVEWSRLAGRK